MIEQLPLTSTPTRQLSYIPEFIMENITDFLIFLGRFNVQFFEVSLFVLFESIETMSIFINF